MCQVYLVTYAVTAVFLFLSVADPTSDPQMSTYTNFITPNTSNRGTILQTILHAAFLTVYIKSQITYMWVHLASKGSFHSILL